MTKDTIGDWMTDARSFLMELNDDLAEVVRTQDKKLIPKMRGWLAEISRCLDGIEKTLS
jgi:hypothetical protein